MRASLRGSLSADPALPRRKYDDFVPKLSEVELHAASTAFIRARGHFHGFNIDRFRDTVLHETFVAIPEYLVQRLFREWNVDRRGELSYAEFIAGVAVAAKGSLDDHLEMIFRMVSPNGDDNIVSSSDVSRFFECAGTSSGRVAVERGQAVAAARSWTADELHHLLFGSSLSLTAARFRAVLGSSSSFGVLHFLDWIPNLATGVLRPADVDLPAHYSRGLTNVDFFATRDGFSSKQRDDARFELRSILFNMPTPSLPTGSIAENFRKILGDDSLVDTIANAWQNEASVPTKRMKSPFANDVHQELKLFVLGLCCVHASSVHQVHRLMFELFDEHSCGLIGVEQLSVFLQLTIGVSPINSEREASIIIQKRGKAQCSLSSPPPSPSRSPARDTASPQVLTLAQFMEVAQQQPGFSVAEVNTALLLFHLKRFSSSYQCGILPTIHNHDQVALLQLLDSYFSEQNSQSHAFCLLGPIEWHRMIEEILKCPSDSSAHVNAQILHEEATELPSGLVMISLHVWLLASFWHGIKTRSHNPHQYWSSWASTIQLHPSGHNSLRGFWVRISISLTGRDGFERSATFPQTIVFQECTMQNVIDAALHQKRWCGHGEVRSSKVTTMCQGKILVAERNVAGEIKTVTLQDDPTILEQDQLGYPLGSLLPAILPYWALESITSHEKLAFELRFSVVEIEEPPGGESTDVSLDTVDVHQQRGVQQVPRSVARTPRGLGNLGNTCFMNAVLQCLAATPMLTTQVSQNVQQHGGTAYSSSAANRANPSFSASRPLHEVFGELLADMSNTDTNSTVSTKQLLIAFSALSPHMADGNQQDAQEFLDCLLAHLASELKRKAMPSSEALIMPPRRHAHLARLFKSKGDESRGSRDENTLLRFSVEDSNGRHDRLVATEWWVSHLINEPSAINLLFSGQFKSTLTCDRCKHQSARFELFSSLQLPLREYNDDSWTETGYQRDLVMIVHSAESSRNVAGAHGPVRVVVQVNEHSNVADVLSQLPTLRKNSNISRYIVGGLDNFTIQNLLITDRVEDQLEEKTPASALPHPTHAFELIHIAGDGDETVAPTTASTQLYLRFVHRQSFLVPFYCMTPTRQALCGSPFVCSSTLGALTGQALHQMVLQRFLLSRSAQSRSRSSSVDISTAPVANSTHHYAPTFVLRRVRDDGVACSRCHWSTGCKGCELVPTATAAELLDLDNCETIAIDWDLHLHPQDPSAFWWLQSYPIRDHSSYINYLRTKTHSLMQSFHSLCSTERVDVCCSHCQQQASTPHTKQLSLWSLPPILVLQLKRFELSTSNGNDFQWKKLTHNVDFPVHGLDLRDLLAPVDGAHDDSQPCTARCSVDALDARVRRGIDFLHNELHLPLSSASRSCSTFDLYAVVSHSGSGITSGHYTAQFRRPPDNCWWNADDAKVTQLSEHELSPSSTAYLLFYVRQDIASGAAELSDLFPK